MTIRNKPNDETTLISKTGSDKTKLAMSPVAAVSPVQRILKEALFPHHGGHSTGQEVRVVLGPIANKVAESQLPRLQSKQDKMESQTHIKEN